ncbi:MAG: polysaccharide biosynthesis protein [Lautropia sp.]|nr:polysaccharide biosynthesis protein [Lautropia sp.]
MKLFNVNPRTFIAMGHDIIVAALVWTFTFSLRWNFDLDRGTQIILLQTLPAVLAVQVGCFVYFGLYRGIWRYASIHDMRLIAMAVGTSALIIPILLLLWRNGLGVPRSLYFLNPLLLILFMCSGRLVYRWWKEKAMGEKGVEPQPVVLLGAGTAALSLIDELNRNPYWYVVGVLDDNPNKVGRQLGGVRILGNWEQLEEVTRDSNCKHAVLAVGATDHATRRRVFELCERAHIKLLVIPDVQELMSGQVKVSQIRYVDVDDLLGRDPVSLDTGGLRHMLEGKSVLVTGGGGSIGSELCRQIARFNPGQIIVFELSEFALYRVVEDLKKSFPALAVIPVVGDIKNPVRLREVFERHKPTIIYHAAAYKHVPILEEGNAWQAVANNAYGTRVLADVASRYEVERFVYISSDKAVNPTNVMGATKRLAEMLLQYRHRMAMLPVVSVRFGNVLGSSGSVIPKFREQIANGGPVTVTHPDITRYFMSIPEATQLVLQAGLMGRGGETFVLDMGQPIRIVDLARTMIKLSGYTEAEIPIAFTGLRPGEKLYEELLADNEKTLPTPHAKLRVSRPIDPPGTNWDISVQRWLESEGPVGDAEVRHMLNLWVPEYRPANLPAATTVAAAPTVHQAGTTPPEPASETTTPATHGQALPDNDALLTRLKVLAHAAAATPVPNLAAAGAPSPDPTPPSGEGVTAGAIMDGMQASAPAGTAEAAPAVLPQPDTAAANAAETIAPATASASTVSDAQPADDDTADQGAATAPQPETPASPGH